MDPPVMRQLVDKMYEKRKAAALDLEKLIRECHTQGDHRRIAQIIDQLVDMFNNQSNPLHVKNGGLIGLAGTAIALGVEVAPYMDKFMEQLLRCFSDPENRIRYFSAECLYNVAKVAKGEILVHFNDIFDALSKLAADPELSVKNGAELLDRLLKDIVAESASVYVPQFTDAERSRLQADPSLNTGILVPHPDDESDLGGPKRKAFSLAAFIPLLSERIYVVSPFTRSFLVSWITVLDSVPELELITYLPDFLDGLLKYLSDPTEDVRIATDNLLADFLKEIRDIAKVQKHYEEKMKQRELEQREQQVRRQDEKLPDITMSHSERAAFISEGEVAYDVSPREEISQETEFIRDTGAWIPGQGVKVDHAAIVEILLQQLDEDHDEIQQSTALLWLAEFLDFAEAVMLPFTPRLIPAILPNLAHHVPMIQAQATRTNLALINVIQNLPSPKPATTTADKDKDKASIASSSRVAPSTNSPPSVASPVSTRQATLNKEQANTIDMVSASALGVTASTASTSSTEATASPASDRTVQLTRPRSGSSVAQAVTSPNATPMATPPVVEPDSTSQRQESRSQSPTSTTPSVAVTVSAPGTHAPTTPVPGTGGFPFSPQQAAPVQPQTTGTTSAATSVESDPFDYQATVNILTVQFLSEHEETRVAALKWLIMLHQKVPKKILAMDDGTFPALLKTLSDSSEEVIKHDLQLLAQISSSSEESYFKSFMVNLLELFSTDRKLLNTRGSLIIRQLCLNLNTERIYRTLAEILEKEEDLEFASEMVQKLNLILITSPELAEFRRRLKSLETRQDGQALFTTLYRSWCHNAVAVFALCLLAQAYEHASNLLSIFADLEITVPLLVQVDKLVQLIESPVFTYIRLQLLEPEKYPYLFKCLYGLLMLLPQSSAFVSLRNRLNAVNSAGFLHIAPRSTTAPFSGRVKVGREDIKWQELLAHFRSVQVRHEKSRRLALGMENFVADGLLGEGLMGTRAQGGAGGSGSGGQGERSYANGGAGGGVRPPARRRVTGELPAAPPASAPAGMMMGRTGALSPLNPRARGTNGLFGSGNAGPASGLARPRSPSVLAAKQRRTLGIGPKG